MAGLPEATLLHDIRNNIPAGSRRVPDSEIKAAINKATAECEPVTNTTRPTTKRHRTPHKPRKPFDGVAYRQKLIKRSEGVSEAEIWEASPYRITWQPGPLDALHVLHTLYAPNEILFIGEQYDTKVQTVADCITQIEAGHTEPYIIPNPFDGKVHKTKDDKPSWRCDEAVLHHRFALVEFDDMPKKSQIAFWHSIITDNLLPVAALIDAGNKSIHSWLRVDLPDVEAWQREIRDGLYHPDTGRMTLLGADRNCQNPSRLSRMPGHTRDNGNRQRLLYLNPITSQAKGAI